MDLDSGVNLVGLHGLVNKEHVSEGLRLEDIERSMIGDIKLQPSKTLDVDSEYQRITKNLQNTPYDTKEDEISPAVNSESAEFSLPTPNVSKTSAQPPVPSPMYAPVPPIQYNNQPPPLIRPQLRADGAAPQSTQQFDEAMRAYRGQEIDDEKENVEEIKSVLLEDIDEILGELTDLNVDTSRLAKVNQDSSLTDIQKVHRILRRKHDRKRCDTVGTELILAGAQGLGYLFDGKRRFGPWTPNLNGWHNNVRPKLRRMRYETTTLISGVMQDYNIGPLGRLMLEFVPSAFIYSSTMQGQKQTVGYTPEQMNEAIDDLRNLDTPAP